MQSSLVSQVFSFQFCADLFWDPSSSSFHQARLLIQYFIDVMGLDYQIQDSEFVEDFKREDILRISKSVSDLFQ
jgi:hypothetical protein